MGKVEVEPKSGKAPKVLCIGGESTGTRLMAEIIHAMGGTPIHRSFPYGVEHSWPDLSKIDFDSAVVMVRNWEPTIQSQIRVGHVESRETGLLNLQNAYQQIFAGLIGKPYIIVSYEALIHDLRMTIRSIAFAIPGLTVNWRALPDITDENKKYSNE
jgi:hypothetical protein